MKTKHFLLSLLLTIVFSGLTACSDSGDDVSSLDNPEKEKIEPEKQSAKRSFVAKTDMNLTELAAVRVIELDSLLNETGRSFKIEANDSGFFDVDSLALSNRYALLRTEGFLLPGISMGAGLFYPENELKLELLVDMDENETPHISLAGHLVTQRVKNLVSQGVDVDSAISRAQTELYDVFAFKADSLSNVSILVDEPYCDSWLAARVIHRIMERFALAGNFEEVFALCEYQFAANANFDDFEIFIPVADVLSEKTRTDYQNGVYYYYKDVPVVNEDVFKRQFYTKVLGLGSCMKDLLCGMDKVKKSLSGYKDSLFICMETGWLLSDEIVRNTCSYGRADKDREVRNGTIDTTVKFYYNEVLGRWQKCNEVQSEFGMCLPERNGEYAHIRDSAYFKCTNKLWMSITRDQFNLRDIDSVDCDSTPYVLGLDSITLYACENGTLRALNADEKFYLENTKGIPCDTVPDFVLGNDSVTKYVCDAQVLRPADTLELLAGRGCNYYNYNDTALIENSYYRCRGRWKYLHEMFFRDTVVDARDGKSYPLIGMGPQLWFAANLDYETENSWCYDDSAENCAKYGRLYRSVDAASQNKDSLLCPQGFHVPTHEEYEDFHAFVRKWAPSGESTSPLLKSVDSHGSDYFGFHADLAGERDSDGSYGLMGSGVYLCTSSKQGANAYYRWRLATDLSFTYSTNSASRTCYVRCLADVK